MNEANEQNLASPHDTTAANPWIYEPQITTGPRPPEAIPVAPLNLPTIDLSEERIREIIAEVMQKVLHPENGGVADGRNRRSIKMWDEDGTEWRGVVYRIEKEQAL